jgi:uncharacterized protein YbbC (DUF1343 family)
VRAMSMGVEVATVLKKLYPTDFDPAKLLFLVGNSETIRLLQDHAPADEIVASWSGDLSSFDSLRRKYLLYK